MFVCNYIYFALLKYTIQNKTKQFNIRKDICLLLFQFVQVVLLNSTSSKQAYNQSTLSGLLNHYPFSDVKRIAIRLQIYSCLVSFCSLFFQFFSHIRPQDFQLQTHRRCVFHFLWILIIQYNLLRKHLRTNYLHYYWL